VSGSANVARTSALFGARSRPSAQPQQPQLKQKAAHSALFGRPKTVSAPVQDAFDELRQRIHGAISDAPRMIVVDEQAQQLSSTAPTQAQPVQETSTPQPPPQPMFLKPQLKSQPDVAFESDDIVPVAQPRSKSKKRKPPAGTASGSGSGSKKARASEDPEPAPAFDYASAPNILDQGVGAEDTAGGGKKREREKKKGMLV
jgi:hypothetical protein